MADHLIPYYVNLRNDVGTTIDFFEVMPQAFIALATARIVVYHQGMTFQYQGRGSGSNIDISGEWIEMVQVSERVFQFDGNDQDAPASITPVPATPVEGWNAILRDVPRDRPFLIKLESGEVTLAFYLDNTKTRYPYEGIRIARPNNLHKIGDKIVAWRELPT